MCQFFAYPLSGWLENISTPLQHRGKCLKKIRIVNGSKHLVLSPPPTTCLKLVFPSQQTWSGFSPTTVPHNNRQSGCDSYCTTSDTVDWRWRARRTPDFNEERNSIPKAETVYNVHSPNGSTIQIGIPIWIRIQLSLVFNLELQFQWG